MYAAPHRWPALSARRFCVLPHFRTSGAGLIQGIMAVVVDWETYMDLHTAVGHLASACNAAERSGVNELVRMVHSEKPAAKDRMHTSYHIRMPEHGIGHVGCRVLLQLLASDYVVEEKGISNDATGHRLMEAVFLYALEKEQPECTGPLSCMVHVWEAAEHMRSLSEKFHWQLKQIPFCRIEDIDLLVQQLHIYGQSAREQ